MASIYSTHIDAIIIYNPNPLEGRLAFVVSEGVMFSTISRLGAKVSTLFAARSDIEALRCSNIAEGEVVTIVSPFGAISSGLVSSAMIGKH